MPIFEFECTNHTCGKVTEKLTIGNNIEEIRCPHCGHDAVRIISSGSFRIKGFSEKNGYHNEKGV